MTSVRVRIALRPLLGLCFLLAPLAQAAVTDIATVPLITSAPQEVKPNLMFVLDDSGSMDETHMPDTANNFNDGKYGYVSSQCNGVYYNPNIKYLAPVLADGTSYTDATFTAAWNDGFNPSEPTVNLSTDFWIASGYGGNKPAFYYRYTGTNTSESSKKYYDSSSSFYNECNATIGTLSGKFTKVDVSLGTAEDKKNFANWYSYYRKRMLAMKSAAGMAFKNIGDQFRVGYMSINNSTNPSFLNIDVFNQAQKQAWYAKLYGARPNGYTPLRQALSRAGEIYAGKRKELYGATVNDPVQYSCQKNFTLLSTDGYWNDDAGYDLSGNAVGNQDGDDARPFNDGGTLSTKSRATITVSGYSNSGTSVTSLKVGNDEIINQATSGQKQANELAQRIANRINDCTGSIDGKCTVKGYSAVLSGATVTITAPGVVSGTPVAITSRSDFTLTITPFAAEEVTGGGTSDTLADVAAYYYETDLRSQALGTETGAKGADVSANNVLPGGDDIATWQHMTTFTLGIGTRGKMVFTPTYKTNDTVGDFKAVLNGTAANPAANPPVCSWQAAGTACTWPVPGDNKIENIDDLWHAAVNGRGSHFGATDPTALATGIQNALQAINEITSDAAAATTSTPNITAVDNFEFSSTFRSGAWYGELARYTLDIDTGDPSGTPDWSARAKLDARTTARRIYTFDGSSTSHVREFAWDNLSDTEKAYFTTPHISTSGSPSLSQFCASGTTCLSLTAQTSASGKPVVDFIRGDRSNEGATNDPSKYFRTRELPARRHRSFRSGLREGSALPLHRHRLQHLQVGQGRPYCHGLRGRQRRHAARLRCRQRRRGLGLHPPDAAAQALQAGGQVLSDPSMRTTLTARPSRVT